MLSEFVVYVCDRPDHVMARSSRNPTFAIHQGEWAFCFAEAGDRLEGHEWKRIPRTRSAEFMRPHAVSAPRAANRASHSRVH